MKAKKKILLVDDEVIVTRTLKLFLDGTGLYEVRAENDATKAVQTARDFKPDLVLLDVMMPELEGGEVAAQMREDDALKDTPIVFLTALVQRQEVRTSGGGIGGFPFIAKPIEPANVIQVIESIIG